MPENFGSGPVLIWWIKLLRSSASELTNNYSKPLNLLCEGCQGCPRSPLFLCFVRRVFYGRGRKKRKKKKQAQPGIETYPSGRMGNETQLSPDFFEFHDKTHYPDIVFQTCGGRNTCCLLQETLFWNTTSKWSRLKTDTVWSLHVGRQALVKMSQKQLFTFLEDSVALLFFCTPSNETKKNHYLSIQFKYALVFLLYVALICTTFSDKGERNLSNK